MTLPKLPNPRNLVADHACECGVEHTWRVSAGGYPTFICACGRDVRLEDCTWREDSFQPWDVEVKVYPHYFSTYCIHDLHDQCRITCKHCPERCRCGCHGRPDAR